MTYAPTRRPLPFLSPHPRLSALAFLAVLCLQSTACAPDELEREPELGLTASSSLPPRGTLALLGFDKKGRTVALMEERYVEGSDTPSALRRVETNTEEDTPPKQQLLFEGERYDLDADGEPGLAHAYRLEKNGTWTRFETKSTSYGFHDSSEYFVLEAFDAMAAVDRCA